MSDPLVSLRARAEEEFHALQMLSYHGTPWGMAPDLDEANVKEIALLIRDLAHALEAAERERDEEHERNRRWLFEDRSRAEAAEARLREVHTELEKSRSELLAAQQALREIARGGVKFDAKGTWSKRVNEIAREALAAILIAREALAAIPLESTSEKSVGRDPQ